jgi:hypothetical protein
MMQQRKFTSLEGTAEAVGDLKVNSSVLLVLSSARVHTHTHTCTYAYDLPERMSERTDDDLLRQPS